MASMKLLIKKIVAAVVCDPLLNCHFLDKHQAKIHTLNLPIDTSGSCSLNVDK